MTTHLISEIVPNVLREVGIPSDIIKEIVEYLVQCHKCGSVDDNHQTSCDYSTITGPWQWDHCGESAFACAPHNQGRIDTCFSGQGIVCHGHRHWRYTACTCSRYESDCECETGWYRDDEEDSDEEDSDEE